MTGKVVPSNCREEIVKLRKAYIALLLGLSVQCQGAFAAVDPKIEQRLRENATAYERAFDSRDAKAIADLWAPDGTFTDTTGALALGRDGIEKLYTQYFHNNKPTKIKVHILSMDSPEAGAIIERGTAQLLDAHGASVSSAPYVAVHKLIGEKWMLQQVNEAAPKIANNMADLAWLAGSWKLNKGRTAEQADTIMKNELLNGGKLLITTFELPATEAAKGKETDLMVTTVDPESGRLIATIYDANGAHGHGVWRHDADGRWIIHSRRLHPDGTLITGTHIITPKDDQSFGWQSVHRAVNGKQLPDTTETSAEKIK